MNSFPINVNLKKIELSITGLTWNVTGYPHFLDNCISMANESLLENIRWSIYLLGPIYLGN